MRPLSGHRRSGYVFLPVQVGAMVRLPRTPQVCGCLEVLWTYYTDIFKRKQAQLGPFCATSNPPCQGGQNLKNCNYARTRCAVEPPVWAWILVCIRKGIAPLLRGCAHLPCVSNCERNSSIFCPRSCCAHFYDLKLYLHIFYNFKSGLCHQLCFRCCSAHLSVMFFWMGSDPLLDDSHRLLFV